MGLFDLFKPNIEKMKEKRDIKGLIKALKYKRGFKSPYDHNNLSDIQKSTTARIYRGIRVDAIWALGDIGDERAIEPLKEVKRKDDERVTQHVPKYFQ